MKTTILLCSLAAAALCVLPACSSRTSTVQAEHEDIFMPVNTGETYVITLKNEAGGQTGAWKSGTFKVDEIKSSTWVKLIPVDKDGNTKDDEGFWINMNQVASVHPVD